MSPPSSIRLVLTMLSVLGHVRPAYAFQAAALRAAPHRIPSTTWQRSGLTRSSPSLMVARAASGEASKSEALAEQVKVLGDEIRAMKAAEASKDDVMAKVEVLKSLKADLEAATNPPAPAAPSNSKAAPAKIGGNKFKPPPAGFVTPVAAPGECTPGLETSAPRLKVRAIQESAPESVLGQEVWVKGWVRTVRSGGAELAFLEINDGTSRAGLQAVVTASNCPTFDVVAGLSTGAAVSVRGEVVESLGKGQAFELQAIEVVLVGACSSDYPLQKKRTSLEFLRSIAHLRARTNTIAAVARVRSTLAFAVHEYFQGEGFSYLQSPLITASDCEGAGEMFRVTTLPSEVAKLPLTSDKQSIDFSKDFFGKSAFLTVSGQLSGEAHSAAMGDIYTFGPTFRAENSQTTRHLAEFHMIEPEMSFCDLEVIKKEVEKARLNAETKMMKEKKGKGNMDNAEKFIKFTVQRVLDKCSADLEFFNNFYDKTLLSRLQAVVDEPFAKVTYRDAVKLLQEEIAKDPKKWQFPEVEFGTDLSTEHEKWLTKHFGEKCTFVYNYPKGIKSFYMRDNDDGETVAAMDLLVPGVGELVGGSAREERLDVLLEKMAGLNLDPEDYWWYLDLRKFGSVPHAGYGLGFERLVCYVTATENIRDAIAFPRYPGHAEF